MSSAAASLPGERHRAAVDSEADEVLAGLRAPQPHVSPRYLYDEAGSRLFEEICRQPEYYPTRTEVSILERHLAAIVEALGPDVLLLEPGSGAADKTVTLLEALRRPAGYVPIDVDGSQLMKSSRRLAERLPHVGVTPVCADFTRDFALPPAGPHRRKVVYFPGSTIGNFTERESRRLLRHLRRLAGSDGALLIGVDLVKAPGILHQAYNDMAGVTARFNLNVLRHLNNRFGTDFEPGNFRHVAEWCPECSHIEMQLWPNRTQSVRFGDALLQFPRGRKLVTEWSHKYTPDGFRKLASDSGWQSKHVWTDDADWFSVHYLEARGSF